MNRLFGGKGGVKNLFNRSQLSTKAITLQDIQRETHVCLKKRGWTKTSVLADHLRKSLGIETFNDWRNYSNGSSAEFNVRKTLSSWGVKYSLDNNKIQRMRYEPTVEKTEVNNK